MKIYLLCCFSFLLTNLGMGQNEIIETLKENETIYLDFHFYPSTLRMLNIQQDTAYNKLIKGVRKLSFYALDADKMDAEKVRQLLKNLEEQEQYESYLEVDGGHTQQVQIVGNATGEEWMTIISIEGEYYLTYIEGTINWLQLPKVYETISTQDTEAQTGFSILLNFFGEDRRRKQNRRDRQRKREAEKKASTEEKVTKEE